MLYNAEVLMEGAQGGMKYKASVVFSLPVKETFVHV